MISTIAVGNVHDLFVRSLLAIIPTINMEAGAIEMREGRGKAQALRSSRGNEAVECRHPKVVEGIEGTAEGVIIEMVGLNAWGSPVKVSLP
jgi:hypothetical protein